MKKSFINLSIIMFLAVFSPEMIMASQIKDHNAIERIGFRLEGLEIFHIDFY